LGRERSLGTLVRHSRMATKIQAAARAAAPRIRSVRRTAGGGGLKPSP
jgi:hypothetical protein